MSKRAFHDGMRQLWVDHVTWTRLFIVSFAADLPDLQATTDRLLQNQVDIGNAIQPFYGKAAGNQLTGLLTQHILTAAQLLDAAKSGDQAAFDQASEDWYANARDIARFLHDANPHQLVARGPSLDDEGPPRPHAAGGGPAVGRRVCSQRRDLRPGRDRDPAHGRHAFGGDLAQFPKKFL